MTEEQQPKKPTFPDLWRNQGYMTLEKVQNAGTKLSPDNMDLLWNGSLAPQYAAEQALNEYNERFQTTYTLDQVEIPTLEAHGYQRRFHVKDGGTWMALNWTWEKA